MGTLVTGRMAERSATRSKEAVTLVAVREALQSFNVMLKELTADLDTVTNNYTQFAETNHGVPSSKSRLRLARVSPLVSNDLEAPNQPIGLLPLRIDFGIACEVRNHRAQCRAVV